MACTLSSGAAAARGRVGLRSARGLAGPLPAGDIEAEAEATVAEVEVEAEEGEEAEGAADEEG